MLTAYSESVTYYLTPAGGYWTANKQQVAIIDLLKKLGLKSPPKASLTSFTITNNTNHNTFITISGSSFTITQAPTASTEIKIPRKQKAKKGFSRDNKQNWDYHKKKHARNTGRR